MMARPAALSSPAVQYITPETSQLAAKIIATTNARLVRVSLRLPKGRRNDIPAQVYRRSIQAPQFGK
jgi:hypothetical protein